MKSEIRNQTDVQRQFCQNEHRGETTTLSIVFDARRNAEQVKRARAATVGNSPSPDCGPGCSSPQHLVASNDESSHESKLGRDGLGRTESVACLELSLERRATDWLLRWNPKAIVGSTRGLLRLSNGAIQKHWDLDMAALQKGSMLCSPITGDVVLRLEIAGSETSRPMAESVRLVVVAPPPPQSPQELAAAAAISPARSARSDGTWGCGTGVPQPDGAQPAPLVRAVLRAPRPEPFTGKVGRASLIQKGSNVEPATLISRREPIYPEIARQSLISGAVEVCFRVSPEGKVCDARALKGLPILAPAAVAAVEAWRYAPARLNGIPIDWQASTNIDFKLD
jgi:TonB family protein